MYCGVTFLVRVGEMLTVRESDGSFVDVEGLRSWVDCSGGDGGDERGRVKDGVADDVPVNTIVLLVLREFAFAYACERERGSHLAFERILCWVLSESAVKSIVQRIYFTFLIGCFLLCL